MESETNPIQSEQQIHKRKNTLPPIDYDGSKEQIDQYAREVLNLIAKKTGIDVTDPKNHFDSSRTIEPYGKIPRIANGPNEWRMEGYYSGQLGGEIYLELTQLDPDNPNVEKPKKRIKIQLARVNDPSDTYNFSDVSCFVREYPLGDDFNYREARMSASLAATTGKSKTFKNGVEMNSDTPEYRTSFSHRLFKKARNLMFGAGIIEQYPARPNETLKERALRIIAKFTVDSKLRKKVFHASNMFENEAANKLLESVIAELPQFTMTEEHKQSLSWQTKQRNIEE